MTWLVCALGVNKQLDLQTLFTQLARDLAMAQGWYEERRRYQVAFIIAIGLLGGQILDELVALALHERLCLKMLEHARRMHRSQQFRIQTIETRFAF